jgi:8-oxo-dGTP pyrophosphatase MutT (NUDIX family)
LGVYGKTRGRLRSLVDDAAGVCQHVGVKQVTSRVVYENAWMSVREDQIRLADGTPGIYGVVDKPDFALVIPRDAGGLWMVEQFRYPAGRRGWEFPQGSWQAGRHGSAAELAEAELREETGLSAARLSHLGHLFTAYGFCSQGYDVYLAEDLTPGPTDREVTEQDMTQRLVSMSEFPALVASGEIADSATLAAYSLLALTGRL